MTAAGGAAADCEPPAAIVSPPPLQLSVVIPTYRRPGLLLRCLEGVIAQRLPATAYEVLVVDDGHEDATRDAVEGLRQAHPEGPALRYLRPASGRGPAVARNAGWRAAAAPLVAFTDDDTVPQPGWLARGLEAIARHGDWSGLCGQVVVPLAPPTPRRPTDHELMTQGLEVAEFVTANAFVRRAALEGIGGFDERFTRAWREDSDLQFRLMAQVGPVGRCPSAVVLHPTRAERWGICLRQQKNAFFEALLYKKHPRLYRERIDAGPPWHYYAIVLLVLGGIGIGASGEARGAAFAFGLAAALVLRFAMRRLARTSLAPAHVAEMIATSAVIPFLSVYWRLRGAWRFRVPFFLMGYRCRRVPGRAGTGKFRGEKIALRCDDCVVVVPPLVISSPASCDDRGGQRRVRAGCGASVRRSPLRSDFLPVLGLVAPSPNSLRSLRSLPSNNGDKSVYERAARGAPSPALLSASQARRSLPAPAFANTAGSLLTLAFAGTAAALSRHATTGCKSRQALPGGGDFGGDEQRRAGVGVRSTLPHLTCRSCLSAVSEANGASSAARPRPEQRSAVGAPGADRHRMSPRRAAPAATRHAPSHTAATTAATGTGTANNHIIPPQALPKTTPTLHPSRNARPAPWTPDMRRLKILTWHVHGNYLYYLTQVPHDFYLVTDREKSTHHTGRSGILPWGANVHEAPAEALAGMEFDVVLHQSRDTWEIDRLTLLSEAQRRLPTVYLEHDPPQGHPTDTRHWAAQPEVLLVHCTPFNALMWDNGDAPTRVIDHGVLPLSDARYSGERPSGIVVVNNLDLRGRRLGVDVYAAAAARVPLCLVGMGSERCGGEGEVPNADLPARVAQHRFFFNPIRYTSLGLAVIEAMMVGVPVVGLATTELVTVIENGRNGFIDTRLDRLVEAMHQLIADPALARELGEAGRRTALARFSIERFVADWLTALADLTR